MTLPAFTPTRFIALTLAAIAVGFATNGPAHIGANPLHTLLRSADFLRRDNSAGYYLSSTFTPVPPRRTPSRTSLQPTQPHAPRPYPPL